MLTFTACGQSEPELAYDSEKPTNPETSQPPTPPPGSLSTKMIFGGTPVREGEMLAIVGLTRPRAWTPSCTGILIQPDMVLSAAHCFCENPTNGDAYVGHDASVEGGRYYKIAKVKLLTSCPFEGGTDLDLAVVKLIGPVKRASPMPFAALTSVDKARRFRVAGFGAIDLQALKFPAQKREAVIPKVSSACQGSQGDRSDAKAFGCRPGAEIVAGLIGLPDSCAGDSGGPLLVTAAGEPGAPSAPDLLLAGVTSRSVVEAEHPCGSGGVYVRLTPDARQRVTQAIAALRN